MHDAKPLELGAFQSTADPLASLAELAQTRYLACYLEDLGASSVLVEPSYFDRDYLSEFVAFYAKSVAGYKNVCRRAHYFDIEVSRAMLEKAVGGDDATCKALQKAYLGFVVFRPTSRTPLGRTALCGYPDQTPSLPRVDGPFRKYTAHVAGLGLTVRSLAWQQQDSAVSACATIALWSMLHSSALDDVHIIPTTAELTKAANLFASRRAFPSPGLSIEELIATVRDAGFAPLLVPGDGDSERFTRERFSASVAALLRSGYPVILSCSDIEVDATGSPKKRGDGSFQDSGGHAVCAVAFRQAAARDAVAGSVELEDAETPHIYVHDDTIGPAVRYRIDSEDGFVHLTPDPPVSRVGSKRAREPQTRTSLRPYALLAATNIDVQVTPDLLHQVAVAVGAAIVATTRGLLGLSMSTRFLKLSDYLGTELGFILEGRSTQLAGARLGLRETVPPMSPHVGLIRFAVGSRTVLDLLVDTTDSPTGTRVFCHVAFEEDLASLAKYVTAYTDYHLGELVAAF